MAKRKTTAKKKAGSAKLARSLADAALQFANTPAGRILIAEILVLAAGVLAPKRPVAAAAEAGASAADTAKDFTESTADGAAKILQALADHLRGVSDEGPPRPDHGRASHDDGLGGGASGNGVAGAASPITDESAIDHDFSGSGRKTRKKVAKSGAGKRRSGSKPQRAQA